MQTRMKEQALPSELDRSRGRKKRKGKKQGKKSEREWMNSNAMFHEPG